MTSITSVEFRNFKALEHYSVALQRSNILVGPNNSGKSTIISAFRALEAGLRTARARTPNWLMGPRGRQLGYEIPKDSLPMSVENAQTDYADVDSEIDFRLSNGNRLRLAFMRDGRCLLFSDARGRRVSSPKAFKASFPIKLAVVPVLGPLEHQEEELTDATVARNLATHRASRHFRNYWFKNPERFEDFADLVSSTWPGMEVFPPERSDPLSSTLAMYCTEHGITRELYWAGSGFQIWCQLLTHLVRSAGASLVVIDEPEIYLHPDIQRQLLHVLADLGPDVVLATHSTEVIGESDPVDILLIDKGKRSAKRVKDVDGIQEAYDLLGSIQNVTLTYLARTRRLLYVENMQDYRLIRRFARQIGLNELSTGQGITAVPSQGFSSWDRVSAFAKESEVLLGKSLLIGAVYDRDYWPDYELQRIRAELAPPLAFVHFHSRKEFENYFLVPEVLQRALERAVRERAERVGEEPPPIRSMEELLTEISDPLKNDVHSQRTTKALEGLHGGIDRSTVMRRMSDTFDAQWSDLSERMKIVPGKRVLADIREVVQAEYSVNLTDFRIIDAFKVEELDGDLLGMLHGLEKFRSLSAP